jgi:hypothetical protein
MITAAHEGIKISQIQWNMFMIHGNAWNKQHMYDPSWYATKNTKHLKEKDIMGQSTQQ